ncbi:MAG: TonB-dependent receptor [Bacteroidales bacterium]|nr:TonB-dependent receptor [Bacteroidales bacterium]MCF8455570.1 TonB-dependent receptor [Bacteroidales bacterium]
MRLKLLILFLIISQMTLFSQAQDGKIKLSFKETSLKEVLREIEKQVDFTFLYNDVKIDVNQKIDIQIESDQIRDVLDSILRGTKINYVIKEKQIVLSTLEINNEGDQSKPPQKKTVKGTVSTETGETLPGVNIIISGTSFGTTSDIYGNYSIEVDGEDAILIFSFIGYNSQEVSVKGKETINIVLQESSQTIEQIVVIGYGIQRKSDLTGSVTSVKGKDIGKVAGSSVQEALTGKVPGMQVSAVSGVPGTAPVIRLRGVGTLNNSSPIYVVDGVILDDISFLSSEDIKTVEVLKDASATAIYGSRGANGVIIITTKLGVMGEGQRIDFSYSYGSQYLPHKIDYLTGPEFAAVVNEINPGTFNNLSKVKNTDWQSQIFQDFSPIHKAQISLSGSTKDKYQYYFGLSYINQEGIISKSSYERLSIKMNQNYFLSDKVRIGSNLTISPDEQVSGANVVTQANRAWPTSVPFNEDGSFSEVLGAGNPLASIEYTNGFNKRIRGVGSFFGEVDILKDLRFKSSIGFDESNNQTKGFTPVFYVSPLQQNVTNDLNVSSSNSFTWLWENLLTYDFTKGDHRLNILGGYTMQKVKWENTGGSVENLIGEDESLWYLDAGETSTQKAFNSGSVSSMMSYLFRTNYTFRNKYLLTFSMRRDGSSKFSEDNRWGYFPSVALGWNIAKEDFFPARKTISTMKIRGSWGVIGNEKIPQNERFSLVANQQNVIFGVNEILYAGATLGNTANPFIQWESTTQSDLGLELGFFEGKYTFEMDYFHRETDDILVGITTPGYFGNGAFVKVTTNAATVLNTGIELALGSKHELSKNLTLHLNANGSFIKNEVLSLGANTEGDSFIPGGDLGNGQSVTRTEVGQPIGSFYGYKVLGILQNQEEVNSSAIVSGEQPGDLKFADLNGDGIIDAQDRTYIGSPIPDLIYGFSANLSYKNLYSSFDFYGQIGNELYNGKNAVRPDLYNFESRVKDRWHGDGTSNTEPRATASGVNYEPSEYFIENGSFLRLRNVTIGYVFTEKHLARIGFSKVDIYVRGSNIFTSTKFSGYSPEIGGADVISSGIDSGTYPVSSVIFCGINLTF